VQSSIGARSRPALFQSIDSRPALWFKSAVKIDLYTWSWNDQDRLGFMFRHYDSVVQRYIVFDDGSDDDTLEILRAHPRVEIRQTRFTDVPDSLILSILPTMQSCWRSYRPCSPAGRKVVARQIGSS